MKTSLMRFHKTLACTALALATLMGLVVTDFAHAGTASGGGGTGIVLPNGKLVVLDLAEAGAENNPHIPAIKPATNILATLKKTFRAPDVIKNELLIPLAAKLTEIDQVAHPAGVYMAAAMEAYEIRLVPYQLTLIDDVDSPIANEKIQLAERKGNKFFISQPQWDKLDLANRLALITHELVYAFQPAASEDDDIEIKKILATSAKARFLNSFFYLRDWQSGWEKRLAEELRVDKQDNIYSYLFHVMAKNFHRGTRVEKMWESANGERRPLFTALEAAGHYGNDLRARLKRETTRAEIAALCRRSIMDKFLGGQPAYSSARVIEDKMTFEMGRVIVEGRGSFIEVMSTSLNVETCVKDVLYQQRITFEGLCISGYPRIPRDCK